MVEVTFMCDPEAARALASWEEVAMVTGRPVASMVTLGAAPLPEVEVEADPPAAALWAPRPAAAEVSAATTAGLLLGLAVTTWICCPPAAALPATAAAAAALLTGITLA